MKRFLILMLVVASLGSLPVADCQAQSTRPWTPSAPELSEEGERVLEAILVIVDFLKRQEVGAEESVAVVATESVVAVAPSATTLGVHSSLRDTVEALVDGEFDDRLSIKQRRQKRILNRQLRRAKRRGSEQQFWDNLIAGIEQDPESLDLMPGVFSADDFDENTPLGLGPLALFDLIDGLIERWPQILEIIKTIIDLFAAGGIDIGPEEAFAILVA